MVTPGKPDLPFIFSTMVNIYIYTFEILYTMHGKSWVHTKVIMGPVNLSESLVIIESQKHRMIEVGRNV